MRICPQCHLRDHDASRTRCVVCGIELDDAVDPRIGTTLGGRYRVEAVIGEGGMATVYRAKHTLMDRQYAVKVLHRDLARDERLVERMRREARSTATLAHPNIVEVYDFGTTDDGAPFLVMELLSGAPLRSLLRGEPLPLSLIVELGVQMAEGLARAHDFGIVHRDLKPENVFVLDEAGEALVKLVDFGIARSQQDTHLTNYGEVVGTPQYMSPERALTRDVTPACDLYSLGVVLFEMATGALPFQSNTPSGFVLKHIHEAPPRPSELAPSVSRELEALLLELLEKEPSKRPVDAHRVVERLGALEPKRAAQAERVSKAPAEAPERARTLELWSARAASFEEVVARAYGAEGAPSEVAERLAELRGAIGRLRALVEQGLRAQRELDALAGEAREGSERLGHAVHVLAKDLSRARDEARSARAEALERAAAIEPARAAWLRALARAAEQGGAVDPSVELLEVSRAVGAAADAWQRAHEARARSAARAERSEAEAEDLELQVEALRGQLAKLDTSIAERGAGSRARVEASGREQRAVEDRLAAIARDLLAPLRERADLAPLVRALDALAPLGA
ncbi:MAG: serine/threonine protein kinase [Sandaracinaceae bacterium]|nr:serine/threonine protein kinase [Sandaracinaceae bacterium]